MSNKFLPKIELPSEIGATKLSTNLAPMRIESLNGPETPHFKDVLTGMVQQLDATTKAPDQVLQDAITGNGADVHDVMIAISKAELGVNMATQVTTKVIQSYEKIMSIQV